MSFLKKLGAVVIGTGAATGWLATTLIKAGLETAGNKLGNNGTATSSNGKTYTGRDFKDAASNIGSKEGFFKAGFKKAGELWNDKDN